VDQQEEREMEQGSFHGRWGGIFVEPQTMIVSSKGGKRKK
jgi:hypothetical protein